MKLRSQGWDVLDQYKLVLANHRAHIHSHWSSERVGRAAVPSYVDVLDRPQVLLEAVRNACILDIFAIQLNTWLLPADYSSTTKPPLKKHSLT